MNQRNTNWPVRIEQRDNGQKVLVGYAAVFYDPNDPGTEFRLQPNLWERVGRTAFDETLASGEDLIAAVNHNPSQLLGRRSSGTLRISKDDTGLRYEVDIPDTQVGHDLVVMVERGDMVGSSFRFVDAKSKWSDSGSRSTRELVGLKLRDVGPVTEPAYTATSVSLRSDEEAEIAKELEMLQRDHQIEADRVAVAMAMLNKNTC